MLRVGTKAPARPTYCLVCGQPSGLGSKILCLRHVGAVATFGSVMKLGLLGYEALTGIPKPAFKGYAALAGLATCCSLVSLVAFNKPKV